MRRFALCVVILFFASGCISIPMPGVKNWKPYNGPYVFEEHGFIAEPPQGWLRFDSNGDYDFVSLTRLGPLLQVVRIGRSPVESSLGHTKKTLKKGMSPDKAAEVLLDDIESSNEYLSFKVLENAPTTVDGREGFRIAFSYTDDDGLKRRSVIYGLIAEEWFYYLRFQAPSRYYFEEDIEDFERIVKSFRLLMTEEVAVGASKPGG